MDILYEEQNGSGVGGLDNSDTKLYPTHHVAVSPNGRNVAIFNSVTRELNMCLDSLSDKRIVKCDGLSEINTSIKLIWSLAISNTINIVNDIGQTLYSDTLIALSCFDEKDMMLRKSTMNPLTTSTTITSNQSMGSSGNEKNLLTYDEEKADVGINLARTFIISTFHGSKILTEIDRIGGLVRFLNDDPKQPNTVTIVVVNVNGISRTFFDLNNIMTSNNNKNDVINDNNNINNMSWWNRLTFSSQFQEFYFPLKIQAELEKLYQNTPCLDLLNRSMENDYFLIEDYKDRVQVVEMYNLKTDKLEMVFHQRAESAATVFGHGNPAVAISKHHTFLAYCRGANSITIYLMENSLEVTTQSFPRVEKILSLNFINDDESLFIVAQEKESSLPLIIVWDLFSYLDNAIRILQDATQLFSSDNYRLVRSCGNILFVGSDGSVTSLLDNTLVKDMLVPATKSKKNLTQLPLKYLDESEWTTANYHTIFYQDEKYENAESKQIIVNDKEPWIHNKNYSRISAFLDNEKTTQLFIGETTVQVWYKKDLNSKEQLKYIWVAPKSKKISIKSLKIGEREFEINFSTSSNDSAYMEDVTNIHWPFKVNSVNDACSALWHLYDRREDPAGLQKQQEYENLIHRTEKLIRQFIKKRPAIWRLIDVRYDVMASLICGRRIRLIQEILNTEETDPSMRYLHTPRLYKWQKSPKTSDLEIAIKCTEGGRKHRDAVMVGFLLDYYSENAIDNTGWMFTVSRALPMLFDHHLDSYAKDLFSKRIFGSKEIHLDESHIDPNDLPQGKLRYIKAFNPSTRLIPKEEPRSYLWEYKLLRPIANIIDKSKTRITHNQHLAALQKVIPGLGRGDSSALVALRSVPLPDFTVFPEGTKPQELNLRSLPFQLLRILVWPRGYTVKKEHKLSPFLKVVRKDKDGIVLDNPAMEAIIDFKWEYARSHFLRHALLFVCYALLFAVLTGAVKNSFVKNHSHKAGDSSGSVHINSVIAIMISIFYYLGYYLLASEIVQCYHEGWRRYISVYNFFDIASIVMPLAAYTVSLVRESRGTDIPTNQLQQSTIAISITILVLWMEMFLLLRYFAVTGNFIYIIVNIVRNIWPFIAFMGIVVLAHGHAMYLLLNDPHKIGVEPDGTQYKLEDPNNPDIITGNIEQTFDLNKVTDNYFSNFAQSVIAVYFWINGRWDQLDQWNFWPVTLLSFIASVLLVIIMQNMLIAFMSGVFDEAKSEGRLAVLKYRSDLIAEYEVLEKPFGDSKGNPRHIFYLGNINKLSRWIRKCEEYRKLRTSSTKDKFYEYNKYYDDNNDNDDEINSSEWDITGLDVDEKKYIKSMNRKSRVEFYSSWSTSTFDSDDNTSETSQKSSKKKDISPIIGDANSIQNEIVSLKDSIKTVEGSIDNRLILLEGRMAEIVNVLNKLAAQT